MWRGDGALKRLVFDPGSSRAQPLDDGVHTVRATIEVVRSPTSICGGGQACVQRPVVALLQPPDGHVLARAEHILAEAGAKFRTVTKTFRGVRVRGTLKIRMERALAGQYPPAISGVEIIAE